MSDIFISYDRADHERVKSIATALAAEGWSVFWDRSTPLSASFMKVLGRDLEQARCVVVFWSSESVNSSWVMEEALAARERNVLFPIFIDDVKIPFGFRSIQTLDLIKWDGDKSSPGFKQLVSDLERAIGDRRPLISIAEPRPNEPVTDEHLALIHSSWRVSQRDVDFGGRRMYQIHVIVFGHDSALARIERVTYRLDPAYPNPKQSSTNRSRNFELKELANGYSVVRADVSIKGQVELVRLSRFINLTETGPRLELEFMK